MTGLLIGATLPHAVADPQEIHSKAEEAPVGLAAIAVRRPSHFKGC